MQIQAATKSDIPAIMRVERTHGYARLQNCFDDLAAHRVELFVFLDNERAYELVAAGTIGAADIFGLPASTTHVLSSGVAGTMAANGSGLQLATIRNLLMAWVLTLPAAIMLSASLYVMFSYLF
jgi:hypothetical protein